MKNVKVLWLSIFATLLISCGSGNNTNQAQYESSSSNNESETFDKETIDPYQEKGWRFIYSRLENPASSLLINYLPPSNEDCRVLENECLNNKYEVAVFLVEAQNNYGAIVQNIIYVFYREGNPIAMVDSDEFNRNIKQNYGKTTLLTWLSTCDG